MVSGKGWLVCFCNIINELMQYFNCTSFLIEKIQQYISIGYVRY